MNRLSQIGVLCHLLGCKPEDIIKYSKTVYKWKSVLYEVVGSKQKTAPASHYTTILWAGKNWSIRELGDKSVITKKIKNEHRN